MSISSGVSKLSSESIDPSLWSKERLIFGAVSFILLGWEPLRSRELGGSEERGGKKELYLLRVQLISQNTGTDQF